MQTPLVKLLLSSRRPLPVRAGSRLGQILRKLDATRLTYQIWPGLESQDYVSGTGSLHVEIVGQQLYCRVHGDVFQPSPFAFAFHSFWLTRRGMFVVVFGLAESRVPENRGTAESFIHVSMPFDRTIRREAEKFLESRFQKRSASSST